MAGVPCGQQSTLLLAVEVLSFVVAFILIGCMAPRGGTLKADFLSEHYVSDAVLQLDTTNNNMWDLKPGDDAVATFGMMDSGTKFDANAAPHEFNDPLCLAPCCGGHASNCTAGCNPINHPIPPSMIFTSWTSPTKCSNCSMVLNRGLLRGFVTKWSDMSVLAAQAFDVSNQTDVMNFVHSVQGFLNHLVGCDMKAASGIHPVPESTTTLLAKVDITAVYQGTLTAGPNQFKMEGRYAAKWDGSVVNTNEGSYTNSNGGVMVGIAVALLAVPLAMQVYFRCFASGDGFFRGGYKSMQMQ